MPQAPFYHVPLLSLGWFAKRRHGQAYRVFCRTELLGSVHPIDERSSDRVSWLEVLPNPSSDAGPTVILRCCYSCPGDDLGAWRIILDDLAVLLKRHPRARFSLAGDMNTQLSFCVEHSGECRCSHCRQTLNDRTIEQWLRAAGSKAINSQVPTHVSGTCLSLMLGCVQHSLTVDVDSELIGGLIIIWSS